MMYSVIIVNHIAYFIFDGRRTFIPSMFNLTLRFYLQLIFFYNFVFFIAVTITALLILPAFLTSFFSLHVAQDRPVCVFCDRLRVLQYPRMVIYIDYTGD